MKLLLFSILSFLFFSKSFANEKTLGEALKEVQKAVDNEAEKENKTTNNQPTSDWGREADHFFGLGATLQNFVSVGTEELDYNLDANLWTSVQGAYKFTKKFSASLGAQFDSKETDRTFQVLGSLSTNDMIFSLTIGRLSGDAVLNGNIPPTGTTFQNRADDFEGKYFAVDLLFKNWKLVDDSLMGFRLSQYEMPAEIETSGLYGSFDTREIVPFLDPNLKITALQFVLNADSQRKFVRLGKEPLGGGLGLAGGGAWGLGIANISDEGKNNVRTSSGGKELSDDTDTIVLLETNLALLYNYNWLKKTRRYSFGIGYQVRHVTLLTFSSFADIPDPSNDSTAELNAIRMSYFLHGPRLTFYGSW